MVTGGLNPSDLPKALTRTASSMPAKIRTSQEISLLRGPLVADRVWPLVRDPETGCDRHSLKRHGSARSSPVVTSVSTADTNTPSLVGQPGATRGGLPEHLAPTWTIASPRVLQRSAKDAGRGQSRLEHMHPSG